MPLAFIAGSTLLVVDKGPEIIENITDVDDVTHAYLCRNKRLHPTGN